MEDGPNIGELSLNERATLLLTDFLEDADWAVISNPSFEVRHRAKLLKGDIFLQAAQTRFTYETEMLYGLVKLTSPNPLDTNGGFSAQWYLTPNVIDSDPAKIELAARALEEALDEAS